MSVFPDSPDYLGDQSDRGESIYEEVGPFVGQCILALKKNKFGSESCLLRQRGQPLPCQRSPRFPEPFAGGVSTRLRGHCSEIVCLFPGSARQARVLPSMNVG